MKIAVAIPCYNECITIGKVVRDFRYALPEADVFVLDNNSTDGSPEIAQAAGAIVCYESRQGKGNVLRKIFREIDADCLIIVDGDDTYPAEDAREMARKVLEEQADMVIGDRLSTNYYAQNQRAFHGLGNRLVKNMVNGFFHGHVEDIMSGYRAFSRIFVKSFPVISKGFEIETEMTIHALDKNLKIDRVKIDYRERPENSISKLDTFTDGFKVIHMIVSLFKNYRPLAFFAAVAGILTVISGLLFLPILEEYLRTGLVPRIPTLVTSGFIFLAALQAITCGLILDSKAQNARQAFELHLNSIELIHSLQIKLDGVDQDEKASNK